VFKEQGGFVGQKSNEDNPLGHLAQSFSFMQDRVKDLVSQV